MRVTLFPCGPAANQSEFKAFEHLKSSLQSTPGDDEWVLLTNLAFSVTHQLQSDELDIVAIGPPGVRVIEVKHWTFQWVDSHADLVTQEADRVTNFTVVLSVINLTHCAVRTKAKPTKSGDSPAFSEGSFEGIAFSREKRQLALPKARSAAVT
jgi:hypothetical protein